MTLRLDQPFRWGGLTTPVLPIPREGMAQVAKAATGLDRMFNGVNPMLSSVSRNPQKLMKEAQALYYSNPWIGLAERVVTRKVAGLPWHVEDEGDDEVDDETVSPELQALRDLLEKPQAAIPFALRQPGINTRRGLVSIISRHMGLCGIAYVHPDSPDANGLPNALIYVNPARVWPKTTKEGNLLGYAVDADDYGNGGTPFRAEELIPFYLEVPDWGSGTAGLVVAAALKARIVTHVDIHALSVLTTGGRIAGLVSPKDGYIGDDEQFAQLERSFRVINEAPDAAKRTNLLRGPVDYVRTGANPAELALDALGKTSRDDILAIWGIPPSQAGVPESRGLNSGEAGKHEYEVLMTGPVHDRVVAIAETLQYELLDRWQAIGINPELVIEEPSFDDKAPAYTVAQSARELPLTNNERRELIGEDPLPDYGPDGKALGLAIWVPSTIVEIAQGPEPDGAFANAPAPEPPPDMSGGNPDEEGAALDLLDEQPAKAAPKFVFGRLNPNYQGATEAIKKLSPRENAKRNARVRKSRYFLAAQKKNPKLTPEEFRRQWVAASRSGDDAFNAFRRSLVPTAKPVHRKKKAPAKANPLGLRTAIDTRVMPAVRRAMQTFLTSQRTEIASRLRRASERQMKDETYWFGHDNWDRQLAKVLRPHLAGIAQTVTARAKEVLAPTKADFESEVEQYIQRQTGTRISGINDTTREAVQAIIRKGIEDGSTAQVIADEIEGLPAFDEARAELVARTETGYAYNTSAVASYREYGVERVQVYDGDGDAICADALARNGGIWTLDEAESDPLGHPNAIIAGTLVSPLGLVDTGYRAAWAGPVVTVRTALGNRLTVTPQHPVLTGRGWVAAEALQKGDQMVHRRDVERDVDRPNLHQMPARIEKVLATLGEYGSTASGIASPDDLHGDAAYVDGEVHVVRSDRLLADVGNVRLIEPSGEAVLQGAHAGLESFTTLGATFLRGGIVPLAASSRMGGSGGRGVLVATPPRDAELVQAVGDGAAADAEFCRQLERRYACGVALDEVIGVERHSYVGQIFDLQTTGRAYFADGLMVSNCTRDFAPYFGAP